MTIYWFENDPRYAELARGFEAANGRRMNDLDKQAALLRLLYMTLLSQQAQLDRIEARLDSLRVISQGPQKPALGFPNPDVGGYDGS